jgi:hypothetical protein
MLRNLGKSMGDTASISPRKFAFEKEFPPGCPLDGANPVNGFFYACHLAKPAGIKDFLTAAQNNRFKGKCECKRRSHSIMSSIEDARGLIDLCPLLYRYVSRGHLLEQHGFALHTPGKYASHHSFWRYDDVSMSAIFCEIS